MQNPAAFSRLAIALVAALFLNGRTAAQPPAVAAKVESSDGVMFQQFGPDQPWQVLKDGQTLPPGGLIVGAGSALISADGAVKLSFKGSASWASKYPVLESGIFLLPVVDADFAFGLDRGRVDLTNEKKEGAATIHMASRKGFIDLTLKEPGTHVIVERYGRYAPGTRFRAAKPDPTSGPLFAGALAVVKGEVTVTHDGKTLALKAPPGPAIVQTDDLVNGKPEVLTVEHLPDEWTAEPKKAEGARTSLVALRKLLETKPIGEAAVQMTESEEPGHRHAGLITLAAIDDLPDLGKVLSTTKYPDVSDFGVIVLRNWLGRAPGQDIKLYSGLVNGKAYSPAEAETLINLLHGFSPEQRARPEVYQALIDYLDSDRLGLRVLAHWHLIRLVPAGRDIAFDPHADKAARDKERDEWRKLLPPGKLPSHEVEHTEKK